MASTKAQTTENTRKVRILYDFKGEDDSQLTISEGQVLTLIGDVTPENWVLAKTSLGKQGYIPDGYFQSIGPPPPPPDATAYVVSDDDNNDAIMLEHNDSFSLFCYQLEWFAIPCIFLGAVFSFMYSTPQIAAHKWRLALCSWCTFIISAFAAYICGRDRHKFELCKSAALVRMIVFILATILLLLSYPIGIASALVSALTAAMELRLHLMKCKDVPSRVTDEWCGTMFGGMENCPPTKLILFFIVLALDGVVFGWGYVHGYNFAIDSNDHNPSQWLNPVANAFMFAFGRIITANLCFILLLQCKTCFTFCVRKAKTCCDQRFGKKKKTNEEDGRDEVQIVSFLHRCMGYCIVCSSFLHVICVYFTYEDSLSTHTFLTAYGWEVFGTGWLLLLLLASVVGSSNEMLFKTNKRLFHQTHRQAILLVIVLVFHGKGFISTYFW
eukprot:334804_1